jgi:hypothetical protein
MASAPSVPGEGGYLHVPDGRRDPRAGSSAKPRKSGVSHASDRRRLTRLLVPGLAPPRTR